MTKINEKHLTKYMKTCLMLYRVFVVVYMMRTLIDLLIVNMNDKKLQLHFFEKILILTKNKY